jgi:hypothetical protein
LVLTHDEAAGVEDPSTRGAQVQNGFIMLKKLAIELELKRGRNVAEIAALYWVSERSVLADFEAYWETHSISVVRRFLGLDVIAVGSFNVRKNP